MSAIQRVVKRLLRRVSDPLKISACVPRCKVSLTFLISYFWSLFLVHVCTAGESAPLTCLKMSAISYSDVIHCIFLHFQDFLRWLIPPNMNNRTISQSTSRKDNQHFLRRCSPDVSVLPYIQAVKVVWSWFILVVALGIRQPAYYLRLQLHGDVPWQHGQQELLLLPGKQTGRGLRVCVCVEKVGEEFTMAVKERDGHQKPPWSAAMFTRWIKFHLFVYLL